MDTPPTITDYLDAMAYEDAARAEWCAYVRAGVKPEEMTPEWFERQHRQREIDPIPGCAAGDAARP